MAKNEGNDTRPPLHPLAIPHWSLSDAEYRSAVVGNKIETERCPDCGNPGRLVRKGPYPFEEWGCPECEPEVFA